MTEYNFDLSPSLSEEERNASLQGLDGQDWGEVTFSSYLVRTCHALRRKPLRDFTVEDLRIMIGQNIGLEYLVPLALEHLQRDPFAAGDFYPGDLLGNVLTVESSFWQRRPDLRQAVEAIVALIPDFLDTLDKKLSVFW
ncbi:MAG TPA: contact-dependent growth inhibition system immunity protein [Ktedonobacteraceae bacterium]|nr:contact-dependent growth inhibition system immunity protein [Ktedonobacteraceae bacterium]